MLRAAPACDGEGLSSGSPIPWGRTRRSAPPAGEVFMNPFRLVPIALTFTFLGVGCAGEAKCPGK